MPGRAFPYLLLILASLVAGVSVAADLAARRRRTPDRDSGDFWAFVLLHSGLWIGIPVLLSTVLALSIPAWRVTRYHLHWDIVWSGVWPALFSLLVPILLWAIVMVLATISPAAEYKQRRDRSNWIAGSSGFTNRRLWILLLVVPLWPVLLWFGPTRMSGEDGYPAALWSFSLVMAATLAGVALSLGTSDPKPEAAIDPQKDDHQFPLEAWPVAMQQEGIELTHLVSWPRSQNLRPATTCSLGLQLLAMKATQVAPQLVEAVDTLVAPMSGGFGEPLYRLIFSSDEAGQIECLALGSANLANALKLSTLVIAPAADLNALENGIRACIPRSAYGNQPQIAVKVVSSNTDLTGEPGIWITDAAMLSDYFMPRLTLPDVAARLGMVVWWNLHSYTGVLAANVWAISRRFHRVMEALGRSDLRTLVFARDARYSSAQSSSFVRRLLPYPIPLEDEIRVEPSLVRPVQLHLINGHTEFLQKQANRTLPERCLHPSLVSSIASVNTRWETYMQRSPEIPEDAYLGLERLQERAGQLIGDRLCDNFAASDASIRLLDEGTVLALPEMVSQGGRTTPGGRPHHVGLTVTSNPYLAYLLRLLANGDALQASRRFVGAEAQEEIFRRHLLLALNELPDTHTGLLETMMREDVTLRQTLNELSRQNELTRRDIRFLNERGDLIEDVLYSGRHERDKTRHPLTTIGQKLCEVRTATEGEPRMWVDEKRLAIEAYKGRVFVANGVRYRARPWRSQTPEWVECEPEDKHVETCRVRTSDVTGLRRTGDETVSKLGDALMKKLSVKLRYSERVTAVQRRVYDLMHGQFEDAQLDHIEPALRTAFETSALVLHWEPAPSSAALLGLCQALRHILPVHLGTETDSVEVVPIEGKNIDGRGYLWGLAIVDLYPAGIGLVKAIHDDQQWLLDILLYARNWLSYLLTEGWSWIDSPLARATGENESIAPSLDFLENLLGQVSGSTR